MDFVRPLLMPAIFAVSGFLSPLGQNILWAQDEGSGSMPPTPMALVADEAMDAPDPSAKRNVAGSGLPSTIDRSPDGLFYVHATVNGQRLRFVVDTGASHIVLTRADARRLGLSVGSTSDASVRTAAGTSSMSWTTLSRISVGQTDTSDIKAMVMEKGPPVSLLGQNMLKHMNLVQIRGDRLTLG